jgi:Subtilase family/PA domain
MRMRRRPEFARALTLAAIASVATALLLAGTVQGAGESAGRVAARAWHSVFGDRTKPVQGERMIVVLSSPSVAERVASSPTRPSAAEERQWTKDVEGLQRTLLAALRQRGIVIQRKFVFTRVLDGFSAELDARAVAELDRNPIVVGIYPARNVYPAETRSAPGPGLDPGVALAGFDGRGVRIALLDTGVDRSAGTLRGRVSRGFDLVSDDRLAEADANPGDPGDVESHGTRMAGLVLRVAKRAHVLPLRVLGWQQVEDGRYAVVGSGDTLIAGLERAVDPNGDGSSRDAADVALAPLVEPFAAFADSPESRAVTGATELGTLVVAPSGNDGDAGVGFGSVAAPGSAADSLSVGALDTRREVLQTETKLTVDGRTVLDEPARILGLVGTGPGVSLRVTGLLGPSLADPRRPPEAEVGGMELADFFDPHGISRVAGRAVLVPADGTSLVQKAENAKAAGAAALLVYGSELPAGALDLARAAAVPVVAVPGDAGREAVDGLRAGDQGQISFTASTKVGNAGAGVVAPFSSGGLAFDGRVRPDLVAAGVGLATDDVGGSHATSTGSSAAAAVVAGAAALVKEGRPDLSARDLRSVLVGSASPLGGGVTREGSGLVDPKAAAAADLAIDPATLAFGRASDTKWSETRAITVKNISKRVLDVGLSFVQDRSDRPAVTFTAQPARLNLGPGASAVVTLAISAPGGVSDGVSGVLLATASGAQPIRIPWAVAKLPSKTVDLVGAVGISNWEFAPSASAPAVVAFRAGRLDGHGDALEPVGVLDVELWATDGKKLGVIARLRDLLPGRYAFGLTGRDANGKILPAGTYVLRLRAQPVDSEDGTPPSTAQTVFRIKEHE